MKQWVLVFVALGLGIGWGAPAAAGDFMDIRLTWTLSDQNLLGSPGGQFSDAGVGITQNGSLAFFDNYETKYTGFETLGHLVLYKKIPSFFDNFSADTALFLQLYVTGLQAAGIHDEGSYIRIRYDLSGGTDDRTNLELTLLPINADRFRLGYSYKISWGGSDIFPSNNGYTPGARLQLNLPWGYFFTGYKTAFINQNIDKSGTTAMVSNHGVLAGAGVDLDGWVAEVNGGFFTRGTFSQLGSRGQPLSGAGGSYQIGYHSGMPIGRSIDFEFYKNDPENETAFFAPERYDGELSFRIQHEGTFLWQRLIDPAKSTAFQDQLAYAFDVNFAIKVGYLRVFIDGVARSLAFILYDAPGFTPYYDFPADSNVKPELRSAVGVDYNFPEPRLTPGIKVGLLQPATYTGSGVSGPGQTSPGHRTVVVPDPNIRVTLPVNVDARPEVSVKVSLRWDFAEALAFVFEGYYTYDSNRVEYKTDPFGLNISAFFASPHILGFNLMAQARY